MAISKVKLLKAAAFALLFSNAVFAAEIPNGYVDGRADVKYGTYYTKVQNSALPLQERLKDLENKAYGLAALFDKDPIIQSEATHLLEFQIIRLHLDIANASEKNLSAFERKSLLYASMNVYADIRHHAERLYENMVRYIDQKIPGPNGQQIREENTRGTRSIYFPNYRSDRDLADIEKNMAYKEKEKEFLESGGNWSEIKKLDAQSLRDLGPYTRVEYVELASNGEIMITTGKAGHLLLAKGEAVKSAGQLVFLKDNSGKFVMMIVSNASGTYKPDLLNAQELADRLSSKLKIPRELFYVTKGEPLSTQAVKIYMKANGITKEAIKEKVKELDSLSDEIIPNKKTRASFSIANCGRVFSSF